MPKLSSNWDYNKTGIIRGAWSNNMMRFDEFTQEAQDLTERAVKILQIHRHGQVEVEHLLLAMLEIPDGTVPKLLEVMGVQPGRLDGQLNETLDNMPKHAAIEYHNGDSKVFISMRVRDIITAAAREARQAKAELVSTEHMLLAILNEHNTPASQILDKAGVTRDRVLAAIKNVIG
jgi:ATP-dependent Clp protease ATP-binding subunit ClpC